MKDLIKENYFNIDTPFKSKLLIIGLSHLFGFDIIKFTSANPFNEAQAVAMKRLKKGFFEGMDWYNQSRINRGSDPKNILTDARSIISLGISYKTNKTLTDTNKTSLNGIVAQYAQGRDYHKVLKKRLKQLITKIKTYFNTDLSFYLHVDDGPLIDRAIAERSGVGWFGKNTNILNSEYGSWIFLAQIITNLNISSDQPSKKNCGTCDICMPACPTNAIIKPYVIDSRKCISFLTIENKNEIPIEYRAAMGKRIFGCDICQDVCPVNKNVPSSNEIKFNEKNLSILDLEAILYMNDKEFDEKFAGTAIRRAKRIGLQRNACVALGNTANIKALKPLKHALSFGDTLVRQHAAWAIGNLRYKESILILKKALISEKSTIVLKEIKSALEYSNN